MSSLPRRRNIPAPAITSPSTCHHQPQHLPSPAPAPAIAPPLMAFLLRSSCWMARPSLVAVSRAGSSIRAARGLPRCGNEVGPLHDLHDWSFAGTWRAAPHSLGALVSRAHAPWPHRCARRWPNAAADQEAGHLAEAPPAHGAASRAPAAAARPPARRAAATTPPEAAVNCPLSCIMYEAARQRVM